ncbi:hypothetical protein KUH03_30950 [Sphingobacterium sp. E70]|uniref:RagB/SusD family nutrient uptake outer membrane protein n=1 Tax=Sphingobacterium sp. E70 TaxID=2853439 RepID=UPI00211C33BB|nr:RagB/SusD family nutrient uptake outer membrane protein [Sphingobacterium sp. E70]ULT23555.1 hypothetical protein KUH03_30950 [Sphingobacterium sp. E70]
MGQNNPSIIFYSFQALSGLLSSRMKMDSSFVKSFQIGDLRKSVYFFNNQDGSDLYTGSYTGFGVSSIFTGLSVEEMILIRAECLARKGDQQKAIDEINYLRKFRFSTEEYKDYKLEEIGDVLMVVLEERRKELYMR